MNNGGEPKIQVTASVDKTIPVRVDSDAFIDVLGFMGEKFLELSPGTTKAELLTKEDTLTGTDPVPLMKIVKDSTELLAQFQEIANHAESLLGNLKDITGKNEQNMDEIFTNLNDTSGNLKEMTHDLKLHPWKLLRKSEPKKKKRFLIV